MKKIAIFTNIPAPYRVSFFEYLQKNYSEYEFHIIYSSSNEDNRSWKVKVNDNSYFLKSKTLKLRKRDYYKYIHITNGVTKILNKIQPNIIIGSEYSPTILKAFFWSKLKKIPFISWTDGTKHSEVNISLLQKISRKVIIGNSTCFIASSSKSKDVQEFYGASSNKIYTSYLTVDIDAYKQEIENRKENYNLLYVGQLEYGKGLDILFNALSKIDYLNFHLNIIGSGKEEKNLKELAKKLGIEKKISFQGHKDRSGVMEYYSFSNCLILPSRSECFGLVILEAMCSGLPVIASNYADGAYDLIKNGETGFIFDLNSLEDLTSKIEYILNNPKKAIEMGKLGFDRSELFRFENVSKDFVKAIDDALIDNKELI